MIHKLYFYVKIWASDERSQICVCVNVFLHVHLFLERFALLAETPCVPYVKNITGVRRDILISEASNFLVATGTFYSLPVCVACLDYPHDNFWLHQPVVVKLHRRVLPILHRALLFVGFYSTVGGWEPITWGVKSFEKNR